MTCRETSCGLEAPRSSLANWRISRRPLLACFVGLTLGMAATSLGATECTLAATGVAFGDYDFLSPSALEGAGTITVHCDADTSYTITLSPGYGSYEVRQMKSGEHSLSYNLYTDVPRTIVWGDGTGGTQTLGASVADQAYPVYARAPAGQNPYVGTYTDNIIVTLTF